MGGSLRIGKVLGISVSLHFSWFVVFGLLAWSLSTGYFPVNYPGSSTGANWLLGGITTVIFFVSVLIHELAHSLVARARGLPVHEITLFIFGGVANLRKEPRTPGTELLVSVVGPLASLVLALLFAGIWAVSSLVSTSVAAAAYYLATINAALALFNLVPGFPLDGGRVLRATLWWMTRNFLNATRIAAFVGRFVAYMFLFAGLLIAFAGNWVSGLWLLFIGWFLLNAGEASYRQAVLEDVLRGVPLAKVMTKDYEVVEPDLTLSELISSYVLRFDQRAFPVVHDRSLQGLITLSDLRKVPREKWEGTRVGSVMTGMDRLKMVATGDDAWHAFQRLAEENVNQLLVVEEGQVLGLVSRANLMWFIRVRQELGTRAPETSRP